MSEKEYIERGDAINIITMGISNAMSSERAIAYSDITRRINAIPSADVEPVVRGYWMEEECFVCSHCGMPAAWAKPILKKQILSSYCGSCGAHMERSGSGE